MAEAKPNTLDEALRILERAIHENKSELQERFSREFRHLSSSLAEVVPQMKHAFRKVGGEVTDLAEEGLERSRHLAHRLDERVHESPWSVIGIIAAGSVILGFLMGRTTYMRSAH